MSEATSGTSVPEGPSGVAGLFGATPELQGGWETSQSTLAPPRSDNPSPLSEGVEELSATCPSCPEAIASRSSRSGG